MTARRYGRLAVTIGAEMADAGLSAEARLVYMALECQPKMSACGLIELQERRWKRDTGLTTDQLDTALDELDTAGWVLVDHDTFEVLSTRHVRDDVQVSNPKIVAGVWNAIDRIESTRLRQAAVGALPDHFPPRSGNPSPERTPDPSGEPSPDDRPDPCHLIPDPSSLSRTHTDATHLPGDEPVDDDDTISHHDNPPRRAELACILIGKHDYDRAITDGTAPRNRTAYSAACQRNALTTWLIAATQLAHDQPDWTPLELAQHLTAGQLPAPTPPPTARAPDLDLRTLPIATSDRGAPIVDLDAARQRTTS